jgi:riboflavin biosynthesis pyrimidine reductase/predicted DsbA family dithiol-disulfide isomerase
MTIPVAHDFICPWCWVGLFQAQRLQREFDVNIEWLGYELMPAEMEYSPSQPKDEPENKPPTPSRFSLLMAAEGMTLPPVPKPPKMRSFNAHQAIEYAKTEGMQDDLVEAIYRAFWEEGKDINHVETLCIIAKGIINDVDKMKTAIEADQFGDHVVDFDNDAYEKGVYNVPTFFIGDQRLAEQPYSAIRKAMIHFIGKEPQSDLYREVHFVNRHSERPFTFINMVCTVDGKIITGERNESVHDLGSEVDHQLMRRLESKADAVLVGGNSLRASGEVWNPETIHRIVVTKTGDLPWTSAFLTKGQPIVLTTEDSLFAAPPGVQVICAGKSDLNWSLALALLRQEGLSVINVLGGSEINGQLLKLGLIDELFLTIAPKIKLGDRTPTVAGGSPLTRDQVKLLDLVSHHAVGDELFLRYRLIGV